MNTEQSDSTDAADNPAVTLTLDDPDDYHKAHRLRQIHSARRQVRDALIVINRADEKHLREYRLALADAVTAYIAELEPLMDDAGYSGRLERGPWDDLEQYADMMGREPEETRGPGDGLQMGEPPGLERHVWVFRQANRFLADVKPLLTEDSTDEWEIDV